MFKLGLRSFTNFQDAQYKCKITGSVDAIAGTGRQTILAYKRSDAEFIGATVWDSITHNWEIFLQEHADENVMLTRRDETGVYFSETYDRLSLCVHISTPHEGYDQDYTRFTSITAFKSKLSSYPFDIKHENLLDDSGVIDFTGTLDKGVFEVSGIENVLPRKVHNKVNTDKDIIVYDRDNMLLGNREHLLNRDPFNDGSMLCAYSLLTNARDATLGYDVEDIPSYRFTKGGYNFLENEWRPHPIVTNVIVDRTATKTIYFKFRWTGGANSAHTYMIYITNLLHVTLYANVIYLYTRSGTTFSGTGYTFPSWPGEHSIAIEINPTGNDRVYVDGVLGITKAVAIPAEKIIDFLNFVVLRTGDHNTIFTCAAIFNRALTVPEIVSLNTLIYAHNGLDIPITKAEVVVKSDDKIKLIGEYFNYTPMAKFDFAKNPSNSKAQSLGYSTINGISIYKEHLLFNGTSGYLYKSSIPDTASIDIYLRFNPTAITEQCIWKIGNNTQGIAIGIDASAKLTLYVRNTDVLTSSAFTDALVSGTWYKFILKNTNITLYADDDTLIETKAHGLIIGTYTGDESIGAAYNGSPILGTTGNSGYFSGSVSDLTITSKNTIQKKWVAPEDFISLWHNDVELPIEIVKLDINNKSVKLWTKVPNISANSTTVITIDRIRKSKKSGFTGTNKASKVWDKDFVGVYHMVPGSKLIDSTENNYDGELFNIGPENFIGHISGYSLDLNGSDEYAKIKYPLLSNIQRLSISALLNVDTFNDNIRVLDLALTDIQDSSQQMNCQLDLTGHFITSFKDNIGTLIGSLSSGILGTINDYFITTNYDGRANVDSLKMLVDGVLTDTKMATGKRIAYNAGALHIGKDAFAGIYFDGNISELFISKKQRSVDFEKVIRKSVNDTLGTYELGSSGLLWTVADMNVNIWLDASDPATMTLSGGKVASWVDKSGNSYLLTQANTAKQPTFIDNVSNGLSGLYFDGIDDCIINTTTFAESIHHSFFVVYDPTALNSGSPEMLSGAPLVTYPNNPGAMTDAYSVATNQCGETIGSGSVACYAHRPSHIHNILYRTIPLAGGCHIVHFSWNFRQPSVFIDGETLGAGLTVLQSAEYMPMNLGGMPYGYFKGYLCERILIVGELDDFERQRIEGYLAHKWGCVGNLLSDHPYKLSAPLLETNVIPWTPTEIQPILWLDASDESTITINIGVSQWNDKSGNNNHAYQGTDFLRPAVSDWVNGLGALYFDGSADLVINSMTLQPVFTFCVWHKTAPGGPQWQRMFSSGTTGADYLSNGVYDIPPTSGDGVGIGGPAVSVNKWSSAAKELQNFHIGRINDNYSYYFGLIGEILLTPVLSDDDFFKVEGYLYWKWGIQDSLPIDHPYKLFAPSNLDPVQDAYWNETVLLMNMNGTPGSSTFTDLKGKTISPVGNIHISDEQSKFGGASARFDGNGDYLSIADNGDFALTNKDFTFEWWEYTTGLNSYAEAVFDKRSGANYTGFIVGYSSSGDPNRRAYLTTGTSSWDILSVFNLGSIDLNTWNHFAFVRQGTIFYGFKNGQLTTTAVSALPVYNDVSIPLKIGITANTSIHAINGFLDDLRITVGVARYTENFTPPTKELTQYALNLNTSSIFSIPPGTVSSNQKDVPVMMSLTNSSGLTNVDIATQLVTDPRYNVFSGDNPVYHNFGNSRDGVSEFNIPNLPLVRGPKYQLNGARRFDGSSSSVINITNSLPRYLLVSNISLSMWIKLEYMPTAEHIIFGTENISEFRLSVWQDGGIVYRHTNTGIHFGYISRDKWCHLVIVRNYAAKTISFYVNNVLVYTNWPYTTQPAVTADLIYIGGGLGTRFIGSIADIRLYSAVLTADEVAALYHEQYSIYKDEIVTSILYDDKFILLNEPLTSVQIIDNSISLICMAWYSFSFDDGITYKIYKNSIWMNLATSDPAIHGHIGENVPYYWDADSGDWVYSGTDMEGTISEALRYTDNKMTALEVNAIPSYPSFNPAIGRFRIGISLFSDGTKSPEVTKITVNNKNYWVSDEYILSDYCTIVAESYVRVLFQLPDNVLDYKSSTKLYCWITGGTSWVECVNGTIPNVPPGLVTYGKSIRFRLVWNLDVWIDPKDVAIELKII